MISSLRSEYDQTMNRDRPKSKFAIQFRMRWVPAALLLSVSAAGLGTPALLSHGRFRDFPVYLPAGKPAGFTMLLSGDEGWTPAVEDLAHRLAQRGAMVVGIDLAKLKANLNSDSNECVFPDGDLENLSHFVQAYERAPNYLAPLLVGYGTGGTFAYAMLAQAPRNTFAGALTLGFQPGLELDKPLCRGSGVEFVKRASGHGVDFLPSQNLGNPWVALQGEKDRVAPFPAARDFVAKVRGAAVVPLPNVGHDFAATALWLPQFAAAYDKLAAGNPMARVAPPAGLSDLPIIEIPARPSAGAAGPAAADSFAIFMSGDGGWAGLDQDVAGALAANGIPVVGLDSLRYYWNARTPDGVAADTDRMIRFYLAHFAKQRVLLVGYSQGADVLPFAVNRLPAASHAHVGLVALMGMSEHALFEFHLTSWVSDDNSGPATLPEIHRIADIPVVCIYGADENDSLCPKLDPKAFKVVKLKGGHHFDGDYAGLASTIISSAKPR